MFTETRGWIATGILTPICLVVLTWTLVIFHSNRRKWQSKDFIISTILSQCIIKQVATFLYTLIVLLKPIEYFETYCGCVKWVITSVDIFQAATIGTLIITRLLAVRFPVKFRAMVKRTHINYHLITLGILSSCIGIASILAEKIDEDSATSESPKYCTFLPYELNPKYAFLSIALNSFVTVATIFALIWTIYSFLTRKRPISNAKSCSTLSTIRNSNTPRHALMTSSSDLSQMSDMSLRSQYAARSAKIDKNNYRTNSNNRKQHIGRMFINFENSCTEVPYQNGDNLSGNATLGNSSTDTLLSSRVIPNYHQLLNGPKPTSPSSNYNDLYSSPPVNRWASESSYLSTSPSSTNSRAPCLTHPPGREENLGLPTSGALFLLCFVFTHLPFLIITIMGTFMKHLLPPWPLNAYLLWAGLLQDCVLPIMLAAVDRNFKIWLRQMYTRQHKTPLAKHQGLDGKFRVFSTPLQSVQPIQLEGLHSEPIKFPITNGSLFTSVDGRLPIIHNYRRGQGQRTNGHCISMGLPAALRRGDMTSRLQGQSMLQNCHQDCNMRMNNPNLKLVSGSFNDINMGGDVRSCEEREISNGVRLRSNHDLFHENLGRGEHMQDRMGNLNLGHLRSNGLEHSDYDDIHLDLNDYESEPIYATLSSGSCCSATTAANDDFEFFQTNDHSNDDSANGIMLISNFEKVNSTSVPHNEQSIQHIEKISPHIEKQHQNGEQSNTHQSENSPLKQHELHENVRSILFDSNEQQEAVNIEEVRSFELENNKPQTHFISTFNVAENVTKLDRYLQRMHQEHMNDQGKLQVKNMYKPSSHHNNGVELLGPVLESLNNLKHLHEFMSPQEYGRESGRNKQKPKENCNLDNYKQRREYLTNNLMEKHTNKIFINETHPSIKHKIFEEEEGTVETSESEIIENPNRIYKKTQLNRRYLEPQMTKRSNRPPTNRRLLKPKRLEKTPPVSRRALAQSQQVLACRPEISSRCLQPRIVPVLSVDSLTAALRNAGVSYLDNGDLWKHDREMSGSVPDFKKVFVSDFI